MVRAQGRAVVAVVPVRVHVRMSEALGEAVTLARVLIGGEPESAVVQGPAVDVLPGRAARVAIAAVCSGLARSEWGERGCVRKRWSWLWSRPRCIANSTVAAAAVVVSFAVAVAGGSGGGRGGGSVVEVCTHGQVRHVRLA